MIGVPAALLGLIALLRLQLYRRQQRCLRRQCEQPFLRAGCEAAGERARRLLRAELARTFVAAILLILIAVCAFVGFIGTTLAVAMALASYVAETIIAARSTVAGLRGRADSLCLGAGIASLAAWGSVSSIGRLPWGIWLLVTMATVIAATACHQVGDWLWLRPRREPRVLLSEEGLRLRAQTLARQCGVEAVGFYVIGSDTHTVNARAESDPRGRRVVLWPALLQRLGSAELDAVIAHELGHLALRHLRDRFLNLAAVSTVALSVASLVSAGVWAPGGFQASLHVATVIVLLPLILSGLRGWTLALYRRQEIEADEFVRGQGKGGALADALLKLSPSMAAEVRSDVWHRLAYDSHPSVESRLAHLRSPP